MKLGIRQTVLMKALQKGSVAATSDVAEPDASNATFFTKTIKLSANDSKFMIESSSSLMDIRYSTKVGEDYGIAVKEGGSVLLPAKEFIDWVKIQGKDTTINLTLSKLATPEIINSVRGENEEDDDQFAVKKIGSVTMLSKTTDKTGNKWSLDCYDSKQVKSVEFDEGFDHYFDIAAKEFSTALKMVSFAVLPHKDPDHILDNVSIQTYKDTLYFSGTDTRICAMYKVEDVVNRDTDEPMLVPFSLVDLASKITDEDDMVSVNYSPETSRMFLKQKELDVRLTTANREQTTEFPPVSMLLEKQFDYLTEAKTSDLKRLLTAASLVNNSSVLFSFKKDETHMTIKAVSESNKYKPNVSQMPVLTAAKDLNAVWGVKHFLNILKTTPEDAIKISVHESKAVKITGRTGENFICYGMPIRNPIYAKV